MSDSAIQKRKAAWNKKKDVKVNDIRFTQKSVKNTFSNGAIIDWTIYMLKEKKIEPKEMPLIRVGWKDGHWKSIDNRRLYCFKQIPSLKTVILLVYISLVIN